jgi:TRAP transporter TAXI family solute receptor
MNLIIKISRNHLKIITLFIFIGLFNHATPSHGDDSKSLVFASGEKGTPYYTFSVLIAQQLSRDLNKGLTTSIITTQGSVESLNLIAQKKADLAMVQGDIAYYSHNGKKLFLMNRSFKLIYPLFLEHIWIISRAGSNIKIFGDLKNKIIALGGKGSGTRHNALDVLSASGLEEGIDFVGSSLSLEDSIVGLMDGSIDAMFFTGQSVPEKIQKAPGEYTFHGIPDRLANRIIKKNPSYKKSVIDAPGGGDIQTLSVRALLVGGEKLSRNEIERVIQSVINSSSDLAKRGFDLDPLSEILKRQVVPLNRYGREMFEELGYIKEKDRAHFVFFVILMIVVFVMYCGRTVKSYDSSGQPVASDSLTQRLIYFGAKGEAFIYTILVFITLLLVDVLIIQYFETQFMVELGGIAKFTDLTLFEGAVSLFLYTASGYTTETFPVSDMGLVLAALLPLIGVATIGGLFLIFIEKNRKLAAKREQGMARLRLENHTVICGWNEAAPALIYNLTSSYAPTRMRVVVVADFKTERPFENEDFDKNYVYYCRGTGTSSHSIENAAIENARAVIVLADTTDIKNTKGLMAVLVARDNARKNISKRKDLFISSELQHPENKDFFKSLGANAVVDSGLIKNQLSSLACISPHAIELFINLLSYDSGVEVYSIPASNLTLPSNISWSALKTQLAEKNISLLGAKPIEKDIHREILSKDTDWENGSSGTFFNFYKNTPQDSTIIYAANDYDDILKLKISQSKGNEILEPRENIAEAKKNVLLIGSYTRCSETRDFLTTEFPLLFKNIKILTEEFEDEEKSGFVFCGSLSDKSLWKSACVHDMDIILVLFDHSADECDKFSTDSQSITTIAFVSDIINSSDKNKSGRPTIISEIYNFENENLFLSAGSNILIPVNKLIALMLSKTVYSKGVVCDFITSLIDGNSDVYMREVSVIKNDCFFGKTFIELTSKAWDDFVALAWLPSEKGRKMIIVPGDCSGGELVKEGDVIIGYVKKGIKNY